MNPGWARALPTPWAGTNPGSEVKERTMKTTGRATRIALNIWAVLTCAVALMFIAGGPAGHGIPAIAISSLVAALSIGLAIMAAHGRRTPPLGVIAVLLLAGALAGCDGPAAAPDPGTDAGTGGSVGTDGDTAGTGGARQATGGDPGTGGASRGGSPGTGGNGTGGAPGSGGSSGAGGSTATGGATGSAPTCQSVGWAPYTDGAIQCANTGSKSGYLCYGCAGWSGPGRQPDCIGQIYPSAASNQLFSVLCVLDCSECS